MYYMFFNKILFLDNHFLQWNWYSEFIFEYIIKYLFKVLRCQVNCTYKLIIQYSDFSPIINRIISQLLQSSVFHEIKIITTFYYVSNISNSIYI